MDARVKELIDALDGLRIVGTFDQQVRLRDAVNALKQDEDILSKIVNYLEARDNQLIANDGPCRDTLEGCEHALRDIYLLATNKER